MSRMRISTSPAPMNGPSPWMVATAAHQYGPPSIAGSSGQPNYGKDNVRRIREIQAKHKMRQMEMEAQRIEKLKPLKATQKFNAKATPKVRDYMRGGSDTASVVSSIRSNYMPAHAKTGPFLPKNAMNNQKYLKNYKSTTDLSSIYHDGDEDELLDVESAIDIADSRLADVVPFCDVEPEERRERIKFMIQDICSVKPLIEGRPRYRSESRKSRHSSMDRGSTITSVSRNNNPNNSQFGSTKNLSQGQQQKQPHQNDFLKRSVSTNTVSTVGRPQENGVRNNDKPTQSRESTASKTTDSGTVEFPRGEDLKLNLDHLELSDDENEDQRRRRPPGQNGQGYQESERGRGSQRMKRAISSPALSSVVRGPAVDYVKANRDCAVEAGKYKRSEVESYRDSVRSRQKKSANLPKDYKAGNVPKYLKERQDEWKSEEEARQQAIRDADIPPGHARLPNELRVAKLEEFKKKFDDTLWTLNGIPVRIDTLRVRQKRKDLEIELGFLEEKMREYSRPVVYILKDELKSLQEQQQRQLLQQEAVLN